jgi:hypothetical protein
MRIKVQVSRSGIDALKRGNSGDVRSSKASPEIRRANLRALVTGSRLLSRNSLRAKPRRSAAKAVELARSGDTVALRLCLERIAPVRKGRPISLVLPSMSTPADVTTALTAIVSQMAEGEITPEDAAVAASVIETKRKALETEELDRRVAVLEQQLAKANSYDDTIEVACFRCRGEGGL